MHRFRIQTLNNISAKGLERFPVDRYIVTKEIDRPDAILVRSHDMHAMPIATSVKAIARAGTGTNNVPLAEMSRRGPERCRICLVEKTKCGAAPRLPEEPCRSRPA